MSDEIEKNKMWLTTENPAIIFENTDVGRLKKEVWDASEEEIERILAEYEVPSLPELGKPGSYIQTTVRQRLIENRRKNDIVIIPVGCTENHGRHTISGLDTFMVFLALEVRVPHIRLRFFQSLPLMHPTLLFSICPHLYFQR